MSETEVVMFEPTEKEIALFIEAYKIKQKEIGRGMPNEAAKVKAGLLAVFEQLNIGAVQMIDGKIVYGILDD